MTPLERGLPAHPIRPMPAPGGDFVGGTVALVHAVAWGLIAITCGALSVYAATDMAHSSGTSTSEEITGKVMRVIVPVLATCAALNAVCRRGRYARQNLGW